MHLKFNSIQFNSMCVFFTFPLQANWFKATQYCRYHGMHLASISSQEENDRLEKHIRDFGKLAKELKKRFRRENWLKWEACRDGILCRGQSRVFLWNMLLRKLNW